MVVCILNGVMCCVVTGSSALAYKLRTRSQWRRYRNGCSKTDSVKKRNGDARRFQCSTAQERRLWRERRHVRIRLPGLPRDFRESRNNTMRPYVSILPVFSTVLLSSHVCHERFGATLLNRTGRGGGDARFEHVLTPVAQSIDHTCARICYDPGTPFCSLKCSAIASAAC